MARRRTATRRTRRRSSAGPVRRFAASRNVRADRDHDVAERPDDRRLRPEPGRPGPHSPCDGPAGTEITLRHAEVLEDGELCTRPLRDARGDRPLHAARRRRRDLGAALHLPRLPLRRDRAAGRASSTADDLEAVVCHSDLRRTGWFDCSDDRSTGCTRTSCGACAATSSTSPPTARSVTSAWAGPATSRCSRRPRRFLYDGAGVPRVVAAPTSPSSSSATTGSCRWRASPTLLDLAAAGRGAGVTPPSSCRGCCTSATATSGCSRDAVRRACAPGSTRRRPGRRGPTPVDRRVPVRRLARPGRAAGQAGRRAHRPAPASRPPTSPARRASWRRPRRSSGDRDEQPATRRWPSGPRARVPRASTSRPTAGWLATRRPRTRSRSSFDLLTDAEQRGARRRAAGRSWSRDDGYHIAHRLRRHAAGLRRAVPTPASRRRLRAAAAARVPVVALPGARWARRRSGSAGTACSRTARSTPAR